MKRIISTILTSCLLLGCIPAAPVSADLPAVTPEFAEAEYAGGTLLFALEDTITPELLNEELAALGITGIVPLFTENGHAAAIGTSREIWYSASVSGDVPATASAAASLPGVVCAEPDYLYTTDNAGDPTEIECSRDWTYDRLHKHENKYWWKDEDYFGHLFAPGKGTIVAVIDTGVDYTHEDLIANMWINHAEFDGTPGVDDDRNGYIDDIHGVNVTAYNAAAGNPMDDNGHGTHVAGIIAMSANSKGGVGLAYGSEIMAIKAGQSTGTFASSDIAKAINYAVMMGADVINMSFGGTGRSTLVENALEHAFNTCVLVASAGNNGAPTTDAPPIYPIREDIYPAGYTYVLGVMATDESGRLAPFSNWDYAINANCEYEITAPGAGIYSALPGNRYALWNGTSMAAPYVSAAAAILRSHFTDKDVYSSRFIMGQLSSATEDRTGNYPALNVYDSIVNLPKPNITVKETFLMDNTAVSESNDGDAIVDAGETIDLGILIRNQWGLTGEITVKADALSIAGVENPYIEFITDKITLEPAGTFQEVNNGFVYDDSYLEAVDNPIRFIVAENCPNDTEIRINLTVTTTNGADEDDDAEYIAEAAHTFRVQAGKGIRGMLSKDTTLTSDYLWIIENSLLIPEGITLTIEPGTKVQFYSSDYEDAYGGKTVANIVCEGTLNAIGTEEEPIEMFPGKGFENLCVEIAGEGTEYLEYCKITNPRLGYTGSDSSYTYKNQVYSVDHCELVQQVYQIKHRIIYSNTIGEDYGTTICVNTISNSRVYHLLDRQYSNIGTIDLKVNNIYNTLFDSCRLYDDLYSNNTKNPINRRNSVFLHGYLDPVNDTYTLLRNYAEFPNQKVTFDDEIYTYGGSESKYVLINPITIRDTAGKGYEIAESFAKSVGGSIACINDDAEYEFFKTVLESVAVKKGVTALSLGVGYIKDPEADEYYWQNNEFYWIDGSEYPVSLSKYNVGPYACMSVNMSSDTPSHDWRMFNANEDNFDFYYIIEVPAEVSDEEITQKAEDYDFFGYVSAYANVITNNAFLNPLYLTQPEKWLKFHAGSYDSDKCPDFLMYNYWGTENDRLINKMIVDADDYAGTYRDIIHDPILTLESGSLEDIYPFVTEIRIEDGEGHEVDEVQPGETYEVHVLFNRDMDEDTLPTVTYGGEMPYTDYAVAGEFVSAREWVGTTKISPVMNSGTMYFRTLGGCAADDNWLVCGEDVLRFSFDVESIGALAMLLHAEGTTNKVTLSWAQNDYDVLAGYNLYRSESETTGFKKLNTSVLTGNSYEDTNVEPGVTYYYYFKVVNTEGNEEENVSNTASAKPVDNIAPVLQHSPIKNAKMSTQISVSAQAADNIGVTAVTLYYRTAGSVKYKSVNMFNITGDRYTATISASAVTADGVEYYIAASDEDGNTMYSGTELLPHKIEVDSAPVINYVLPLQLNIEGGQTVTVMGINFTENMTLTLGDTEIDEITFVDSKTITFTSPAMNSGHYALRLTDDDGRTASAPDQLVFTDDSSTAQIPTFMEMLSGEDYTIPFVASADSAVSSVHFELDLPFAYFRDIRVKKADAKANFTLDYNYSGGVLKVSCIGSSDIITQDTLVNIIVTPVTDESVSYSIPMHDVRFNGADVHTVISGTAQLTPVFRIEAEVYHRSGDTPVAGVVIKADGQTAVTDQKGRAELRVVNKNVTVTASSSASVPAGVITSYDASLVLQYSVGKTDLDEYQLIAGDVNADGNVNEYDASVILQMAVRKISIFPCGIRWSFAPASVSMDLNASGNTVSFTAICIGDVDGSAGEAENGTITPDSTGFEDAPELRSDRVIFSTVDDGTVYYYYTDDSAVPSADEFHDAYDDAAYADEIEAADERIAVNTTAALKYPYMVLMFEDDAGNVYLPVLLEVASRKTTGFEADPIVIQSGGDCFVYITPSESGEVWYFYSADEDDVSPAKFGNIWDEASDNDLAQKLSANAGEPLSITLDSMSITDCPYVVIAFYDDVKDAFCTPVTIDTAAAREDNGSGLTNIEYDGKYISAEALFDGRLYWYHTDSAAFPDSSSFAAEYEACTDDTIKGSRILDQGDEVNFRTDGDYKYVILCLERENGSDDGFMQPIAVNLSTVTINSYGFDLVKYDPRSHEIIFMAEETGTVTITYSLSNGGSMPAGTKNIVKGEEFVVDYSVSAQFLEILMGGGEFSMELQLKTETDTYKTMSVPIVE